MTHFFSTTALCAMAFFSNAVLALPHDIEKIHSTLLPQVRITGEQYKPHTVDAAMATFNLPGLSVAVIKNAEVVWAKGYGVANKKTGRPVTTDTLFQAASISKPIAALAVLNLAEQGKVNLDTDINTYLKSWKMPSSEFGIVTLRHLLTHSSGLAHQPSPGYLRGAPIPSDVASLNGEGNTNKVAANFKAGSQFRYSTDGYAILDVLIEDITGRTFSEYVDKTILEPLSMNQSTFAQPLPKALWQQASAAFDAQGNQIQGDWRNYPKQSAAGLWTTPLDLAKYIIAVQKAKKGTTTGPITPKLVENMLSLHLGGMGLGPMLKNEKQGLVFHHSGKSAGFSNRFHAYVDKADGMVIMTNGDSARPVVGQLQNAISAHFNWDLSAHIEVTLYAMDNAKRADLVGEYAWEKDTSKRMRIVKQGDEFEIHNLFEGGQFKFIAEAPDTLISTSTGVKVNIETNPQGKVTAILWSGRFRLNKRL